MTRIFKYINKNNLQYFTRENKKGNFEPFGEFNMDYRTYLIITNHVRFNFYILFN